MTDVAVIECSPFMQVPQGCLWIYGPIDATELALGHWDRVFRIGGMTRFDRQSIVTC